MALYDWDLYVPYIVSIETTVTDRKRNAKVNYKCQSQNLRQIASTRCTQDKDCKMTTPRMRPVLPLHFGHYDLSDEPSILHFFFSGHSNVINGKE